MFSLDDLQFVNYSSDFQSEDNECWNSSDTDTDDDSHEYDPTDIYCELKDEAITIAEEFEEDFQTHYNDAKMIGVVNAIVSVTGDDEIITTDNMSFSFLMLAAAQIISGIKISKKDTGFSKRKGNYTEGWIALPPNAEADFSAVNRRHKRDGVPVVFDITKLKATSAVRKQSNKELDLESKFSQLYKAAEWTDESWFTYDYAQQSLLFASAIFDFSDTRTFPYLYGTEGGCGGAPPWKNVDTAFSAACFFNGNRATNSILAIMDESAAIQEGRLEPRNANYVNVSHYAQLGNQLLGKIVSAKRLLRTLKPEERADMLDACKGADPLPPELVDKSVIIDPKDQLLGSAISELRSNGLIMTELDVRLKAIGEQKKFDLLKDQNMGIVKNTRQKEKDQAKKNGYAELAKLSQSDKLIENISSKYRSIMGRYYGMRKDFSNISSFSYEGLIRVFKTSDILDYYESSSFGIQDDILASLSINRNYDLSRKLGQAKHDLEYQIEWIQTGELSELFNGEIPPSLGSDDARIARKILRQIPEIDKEMLFLIITDDKACVSSTRKLIEKFPNISVERIPTKLYILDSRDRTGIGNVKLKNIFTQTETAYRRIEKLIASSVHWRKTEVTYQILWDFPNINRSVEGLRLNRNKEIFKIDGGYFLRETAKNLAGWPQLEWSQFKALSDFERTLRKYS